MNRERQWTSGDGRPGFVGSRPAQVVSLEEFQEFQEFQSETAGEVSSKMEDDGVSVDDHNQWEGRAIYTYPCRCGGMYKLTTDDLESGHHLVGCESCSEVIWVGYEEVVD